MTVIGKLLTINSWLDYLSLLRAVVGVYARGEGVVGVLLTFLWMVLVELGHNI